MKKLYDTSFYLSVKDGYSCYSSSIGQFRLARQSQNNQIKSKSYYWENCRELFLHNFNKNSEYILISHSHNKGIKIAQFIKIIEKKLKLSKKSTVIGFQNASNISAIKPSEWWKETALRKGLLTILLRCGCYYHNSFDYALYLSPPADKYIYPTKPAVQKFLKGYTKYKGRSSGWVRTFQTGKNLQKLIK